MSRKFLLGSTLLISLFLVGLVGLAVYQVADSGAVAISTLTLLVAAVSCLLILFGVMVARQQPVFSRPYCTHCGARVYETRRAFDRRRVMTCFACGTEWVVPTPPPSDLGLGIPPNPPTPTSR